MNCLSSDLLAAVLEDENKALRALLAEKEKELEKVREERGDWFGKWSTLGGAYHVAQKEISSLKSQLEAIRKQTVEDNWLTGEVGAVKGKSPASEISAIIASLEYAKEQVDHSNFATGNIDKVIKLLKNKTRALSPTTADGDSK